MKITAIAALACAAVASSLVARAETTDDGVPQIQNLRLEGVQAAVVDYRGRQALKLTETPGAPSSAVGTIAILKGVELRDGIIELDVAGSPAPGAAEGARGFIGVAFRVSPGLERYEYVYLRPTNGRADDQVRRNHSTQYASHPDYPWPRLRKESPEKYESYVDLEAGVWTPIKIVIQGLSARLYVHGAEQPTLLVNDLKLGETTGAVALWIGPGTEGYFSRLRVSPK